VRAHDLELSDDRARSIPGVVLTSRRLAGLVRLEVEIPGRPEPLGVELPEAIADGRARLVKGSRVLLKPRRYGVFPRGSDGREAQGWITAVPRLAAVS